MEYAIWYVATIIVLQAFIAVRNPHVDVKTFFVSTVFWPFIMILVAGSFALDAIGWNFDMVRSPNWIGFRKSPNPKITGYAVSLFKFELQLFKVKA